MVNFNWLCGLLFVISCSCFTRLCFTFTCRRHVAVEEAEWLIRLERHKIPWNGWTYVPVLELGPVSQPVTTKARRRRARLIRPEQEHTHAHAHTRTPQVHYHHGCSPQVPSAVACSGSSSSRSLASLSPAGQPSRCSRRASFCKRSNRSEVHQGSNWVLLRMFAVCKATKMGKWEF